MSQYVLLLNYHTEGVRLLRDHPENLVNIEKSIERWECKILASYALLGEYDQCLLIEAPDNFKAYRASLGSELSSTAQTEIMPAIDLPMFQRLMTQSAETDGPHKWQIKPWARAARMLMRPYAYGQFSRKYFKPLMLSGQENLQGFKGPCIVVANHTSHLDQYALFPALSERIKSNLYFGAAADRWFLKGRDDIRLQPWYQSLVMGLYPIQRGGGGRTLEYPKWLLDQGCNLMLFPEGTRARGKGLGSFKYGVAILALEKNVPVLPVYLGGLKALRPPGSREIRPGPAAAHVLPPMHFAAGTPVPDATRQLFEAMNTVHQQAMSEGLESLGRSR